MMLWWGKKKRSDGATLYLVSPKVSRRLGLWEDNPNPKSGPFAEKDCIWDCASYRWKWEDRSFGRRHGYKTLADACVKRNSGGNNQYYCLGGNLGYVPRKLRKQQLRDLGRVPQERYVREK